jgi:hypothetical protein
MIAKLIKRDSSLAELHCGAERAENPRGGERPINYVRKPRFVSSRSASAVKRAKRSETEIYIYCDFDSYPRAKT